MGDEKRMRVAMTLGQAKALGIVFCKCGHPPNNHFANGMQPCAHCQCLRYRQTIRLPADETKERG